MLYVCVFLAGLVVGLLFLIVIAVVLAAKGVKTDDKPKPPTHLEGDKLYEWLAQRAVKQEEWSLDIASGQHPQGTALILREIAEHIEEALWEGQRLSRELEE